MKNTIIRKYVRSAAFISLATICGLAHSSQYTMTETLNSGYPAYWGAGTFTIIFEGTQINANDISVLKINSLSVPSSYPFSTEHITSLERQLLDGSGYVSGGIISYTGLNNNYRITANNGNNSFYAASDNQYLQQTDPGSFRDGMSVTIPYYGGKNWNMVGTATSSISQIAGYSLTPVTSAVPIPPAAIMFASGLLGLGAFRSKAVISKLSSPPRCMAYDQ
jgi:hypothetical protein